MTSNGNRRGEQLWGWVVRLGCGFVFVHATVLREVPNFLIATLAIAGAALPLEQFGRVLVAWFGRRNGNGHAEPGDK